jgi:hypothetical protein
MGESAQPTLFPFDVGSSKFDVRRSTFASRFLDDGIRSPEKMNIERPTSNVQLRMNRSPPTCQFSAQPRFFHSTLDVHRLSKLRFQTTRLYLAKPVTSDVLDALRAEVKTWSKPD